MDEPLEAFFPTVVYARLDEALDNPLEIMEKIAR
jgi:hypothetical protein